MKTPRILDLYCKAGGASMGYSRAGFDVVGVDIEPQPRYPFPFILGDAIDVMTRMLAGERFLASDGNWYGLDDFDAFAASPPCQGYSVTQYAPNCDGSRHPDLLPSTRVQLIKTGKPWVIENVVGAPVWWAITLCGTMFGLKTYRHRLFEMSFLIFQPGHPEHVERLSRKGRAPSPGGFSNPCGHTNVAGETELWKKSLDIDWMTTDEITQAIPPAYTEFIGRQLLAVLR